MDERQMDKEITILVEKVKALEESKRDQFSRIESHFESERRHRELIREKLNSVEKSTIDNREEIKEHREILFNKGAGLMFVIRDLTTRYNHTNSMMARVIQWGSLIIAAVSFYFAKFK